MAGEVLIMTPKQKGLAIAGTIKSITRSGVVTPLELEAMLACFGETAKREIDQTVESQAPTVGLRILSKVLAESAFFLAL